MQFKNDKHRRNYEQLLAMVHPGTRSSIEYQAALYILAAIDYKQEVIAEHIGDGIRFRELVQKARTWSTAERRMVELAGALFNGRSADLDQCFRPLDKQNTAVTLEAMKMRYL
ncbi:MAG: hypothetical protein H0Z40_01320 [Desulfotomaculum sp.]|nr:hypothetical protein [Desulfotomaculum sp.]